MVLHHGDLVLQHLFYFKGFRKLLLFTFSNTKQF